jgi:membrane associated rhomboid family serine protease
MLTAVFIHIGVIHILMNMFVLWSAGPVVEKIFGSVSFAVLYIVAGLGGSIASLAWRPEGVSAGASGAVFGIFGGLLGFLALHRKSVDPNAVKALGKYAGTFLLYNVVYGAMQSHIDMAAHLGGLVAGFVMGMALAMPFAENAARVRRAAIAGVAGLACIAFLATRLNARTVMIGNDEVKYTSKVEKKDAEALGQYLKKDGFFQDKGVIVELSRNQQGQEISLTLKEGAWDNPGYLENLNEGFGPEVATAVTGVPLTINLLDGKGTVRRSIEVTRKILHVGKNDRVYYEGSATKDDAETLGRALQAKQFFLDTGRAMTLIKQDNGRIIALNVNEKAYNDPNYEKFAMKFGHDIAPEIGGLPLTVRLLGPRNFVETLTGGGSALSKDVVVR